MPAFTPPEFRPAVTWLGDGNSRIGDIIFALHLVQPGHGTPEFPGTVAFRVDLVRRHLGRGDQQRTRLVKRVDQDVEALRLIAPATVETRDALKITAA